MTTVPPRKRISVKEDDVIMQKFKEAYERSFLTVTEFEKDDVITTSEINPIAGLGGNGDNDTPMMQNK